MWTDSVMAGVSVGFHDGSEVVDWVQDSIPVRKGLNYTRGRWLTDNDRTPDIMNDSQAKLSAIYGFRAIGDQLGTAGQPTEAQFSMIREYGFDAVVNLALPTSDNAIANEGSIVTSLGLSYVHIPVDFKAPTSQNFRDFCRVMDGFDNRPVFVHCAANMRVSAFVFLYRVIFKHISVADAEVDLHAIWQPDEVWSRFIRDELKNHNSAV